jgi:hypothetical protein
MKGMRRYDLLIVVRTNMVKPLNKALNIYIWLVDDAQLRGKEEKKKRKREVALSNIYRVYQKFCNIFNFPYSSTWQNDKILVYFLKDAPSKVLQKLYKRIPIDLFWSFFPYSKWKSNMIVLCPTVIKMFERLFCFAYISAWENDKILIFLLKDAPWKALQKLYKQISIDLFWWFSPYSKWKR